MKNKVVSPLALGKSVLIRTVTHYHTGRIVLLTSEEVVLKSAAWIASTGRFTSALKDGVLDEVELFPGLVSVNRGAIVDVCEWRHTLPAQQK